MPTNFHQSQVHPSHSSRATSLRIVPALLKLKKISALAGLLLAFSAISCSAQTSYQVQSDSNVQPGVPQGEMLHFPLESRTYYPGAKTTIGVYVPAEYKPDKPACLYVALDDGVFNATTVIDNLIYKKQMPVTICVILPSSEIDTGTPSQAIRYDRCFEFDSTNDRFDRYFVNEVMPRVRQLKTSDGRAVRISSDPNDHMIAGFSSGGVASFTAAWQHPDLFRRVFTAIGTYVGMRGADMYPTLIRKTEPKPIRIFLQDGAADTWNPLFDNWHTQNKSMEESLSFAGYDVNHNWGLLGHELSHATSLFPSAMRWMWRDYPQPIEAGVSGNSMLKSILVPGNTWQPLTTASGVAPQALAVNRNGDVYFTDSASGNIYKCGAGKQPAIYARAGAPVTGEAFGHDGTLYAAQPTLRRILAISPTGKRSVFATGIVARSLTVLHNGSIYATTPAAHDDMPSIIWRIDASGRKTQVDSGLRDASGVVATPDHNLLFAAEGTTHWIYSYVMQANGTLSAKQRFYWLHTAESASEDDADSAGATDLTEDNQGNLYVATRMGVQICDRNGRVEGILTLPAGQVTSLTIGGKAFNTLTIVCGGKLYTRDLKVNGVPGFADIVALPKLDEG